MKVAQIVSYEPGEAEASVLYDLARLPEDMRRGAVAMAAILAARALDTGGLVPRDAQGFQREMRLSMAQLQENSPGDRQGDVTDEVRKKREERLSAG